MSVDKRWLAAFVCGALAGCGARAIALCRVLPYIPGSAAWARAIWPSIITGCIGIIGGVICYFRASR